ncbi:hypothetical protein Bbelb_154330 [Branchiostoma belcheri]|nr:hypothetical protein Bbelb_154330 [Branchiostoma belcheri]
MRPDKTPQDTGVSEQQCSCTCFYQMRPDKTRLQRIQEYQVYPEEQQCSCTCLHQMRPDKTPQDTGVSEQQCSCTCLHRKRPDKIQQDTGVSDVDSETGLSGRKNQTSISRAV